MEILSIFSIIFSLTSVIFAFQIRRRSYNTDLILTYNNMVLSIRHKYGTKAWVDLQNGSLKETNAMVRKKIYSKLTQEERDSVFKIIKEMENYADRYLTGDKESDELELELKLLRKLNSK